MQTALKSEQAVQGYIDSMLLDFDGSDAHEVDALSSDASQPQNRPVPLLPAASVPQHSGGAGHFLNERLPLATAAAMPHLKPLRAKSLVEAIAQAGAARAEQSRAASTSRQSESEASAGEAELDSQAAPQNSAVDGSASPEAGTETDRSALFLKHLEVAQTRTSQRLSGGSRRRPAALAQAPAWVETEQLRCLVFKLANLKLALPVQYLAGVAPLDLEKVSDLSAEKAESLQGELAALCMGAIGEELLIDTARLVMPERYVPSMREQYRQMLRISDMNWSFAVESIGSEVTFNAQKVRWRSQHTRREWLAGTVIDEMCAIIDVDTLHRNLLAASVLGAPLS